MSPVLPSLRTFIAATSDPVAASVAATSGPIMIRYGHGLRRRQAFGRRQRWRDRGREPLQDDEAAGQKAGLGLEQPAGGRPVRQVEAHDGRLVVLRASGRSLLHNRARMTTRTSRSTCRRASIEPSVAAARGGCVDTDAADSALDPAEKVGPDRAAGDDHGS
jgi:hypothetical protein